MDIIFLEQLTGALYLDKIEDVQDYRMVMDRMCILAKPPAQTINYLSDMLKKS